jgi:hypothetical protein
VYPGEPPEGVISIAPVDCPLQSMLVEESVTDTGVNGALIISFELI